MNRWTANILRGLSKAFFVIGSVCGNTGTKVVNFGAVTWTQSMQKFASKILWNVENMFTVHLHTSNSFIK